MKRILIPISTGFEEIETVSIVDVCRRAGIEVIIASIEKSLLVEGSNGITLESNSTFKDAIKDEFDMVVLPGGLPNAFNLAENKELQDFLYEIKKNNKFIAAICAAPFALHQANVLNQKYTCYPSFEEKIRKDGYIKNEEVVVDDNIITSQGPATAMKFSLKIVEILLGYDKKVEIQKQLLYK